MPRAGLARPEKAACAAAESTLRSLCFCAGILGRSAMGKSSDDSHVSPRLDERRAQGAQWRRQVPLAVQAEWKLPAHRADPVDVLIEQGKSRIAELLPVRYA